MRCGEKSQLHWPFSIRYWLKCGSYMQISFSYCHLASDSHKMPIFTMCIFKIGQAPKFTSMDYIPVPKCWNGHIIYHNGTGSCMCGEIFGNCHKKLTWNTVFSSHIHVSDQFKFTKNCHTTKIPSFWDPGSHLGAFRALKKGALWLGTSSKPVGRGMKTEKWTVTYLFCFKSR